MTIQSTHGEPDRLVLAIYDGQRCLGFLIKEQCKRYTAYNGDYRCLGDFPDEQAAFDAVAARRARIVCFVQDDAHD